MARNRSIVLATLTALAPLSAATADVLAPGADIALGGTTSAASPWLQGPSPAAAVPSFEVRDTSNNVVFTGTLLASFTHAAPFGERYCNYRVQGQSAVGGRHIVKIDLQGFGTNFVDAEYRTDFAPAPAPSLALRTPDGDTVTFHFPAGGIPAGAASQFFYIYTGTTHLAETGTARITLNTGEFAVVTGLPAPASPVVCEGDTNADSAIDFSDLNSVLSNFGDGCD